ncbi:MAG: hypothetical protein QOE33_3446 [Acidobacteriota bacterium]|nr:hypothetical protein [Acidobacteriota bacterium]
MLAALATAFALPAFAQDPAASPAALCDETAKGDLYKQYYDLKKTDQAKAFDVARQYLDKYGSCTDNYTSSVKKFSDAYSKATSRFDFFKAYDAKDVSKLTTLSRQLLANDPNDAAVALLTFAGISQGLQAKNPAATQADLIEFANKSLAIIEAGKEPTNLEGKVNWLAFADKQDAIGAIHYTLGVAQYQTNPDAAVKDLLYVAQSSTKYKEYPAVYSALAFAYEKERQPMADKYKTVTENFTKETDESKLLLLNINQVVDRQIDAYARAVAYETDATKKAQLMSILTELYKSRHNNTVTGLDGYVAGIKAQPLLITQPVTSLPAATPAATPGAGEGAPATMMPAASPMTSPAAKPATTTPPKPQTGTPAASSAPARKRP